MRTSAKAFIDHILKIWGNCDYYSPPEGCSEDEISEIAHAQNVTQLPEYYVEFMRRFGKQWDAGEHFYPAVLSFKGPRGATRRLESLGIGHWFVFLIDHDADVMFVFDPEDKIDPVVFRICESYEDNKFKSVIEPYELLSDILIEWIEFCDE